MGINWISDIFLRALPAPLSNRLIGSCELDTDDLPRYTAKSNGGSARNL